MKFSFFSLLPFLLLLPAGSLPAQTPNLVADINQLPSGSIPSGNPKAQMSLPDASWNSSRFPRIGPLIFFQARGVNPKTKQLTGEELFQATTARNSARLAADILPGPLGSFPKDFLVYKGKLYFTASPSTNPNSREIFEYDPMGTPPLKQLTRLGKSVSGYRDTLNFTAAGGNLYYFMIVVYSGGYSSHLYKLNLSTLALTRLGVFCYRWFFPTVLGNRVLFLGCSSSYGKNAWVTDGTPKGTLPLRTFLDGYFQYPVKVGNYVYFGGRDSKGWGIWRSDGTPAGTKLMAYFANTTNYSSGVNCWKFPVVLGNKIIFGGVVKDRVERRLPYAFDTTSSPPKIVRLASNAINHGYGFYNPVIMASTVYFAGYFNGDPLNPKGWYLWRTNGTPQTTKMVTNSGFGVPNSWGYYYWYYPTVIPSGRFILFKGLTTSGFERLWRTDGTAKGTYEVAKIGPGVSSKISYLTEHMGKCFFLGYQPATGAELWCSDGTRKGTFLHSDVWAPFGGGPTVSSYPKYFTELLGYTFFCADDGKQGEELWRSDGTQAGTKIVADLYPGSSGSKPLNFFPNRASGELFFLASDAQGYALWKSDGTAAGTVKVSSQVYTKSSFHYKIALGDRILFDNYSYCTGREVWVTDGKSAHLLKDCYPGGIASPNSGGFYDPVRIGKHVYFLAYNGSGRRLWVTDGTSSGTKQIPIPSVSLIDNLRKCGNKLFFEGATPSKGAEPWIYDPASGKATLLTDINPGAGHGRALDPFTLGGRVFFLAQDSSLIRFYQLWVTDGTSAGTRKVSPQIFCNLYGFMSLCNQYPKISGLPFGDGTRALFFGFTVTDGYEPWVTDGTAAGTYKLATTYPGNSYGYPYAVRRLGSRKICFGLYRCRVNNISGGSEMWVTDGTKAGTRPVTETLYPGFGSGWYLDSCGFGVCNGRVFFSGLKKEPSPKGYELYAWFPGATAMPVGAANGSGTLFSGTDPVIGGAMKWSFSGAPSGTGGLVLLGAPAMNPFLLPGSGLYFNLSRIFGLLPVTLSGGSGSLSVPIPNSPAFTGLQLATQGFVAPTSTPPFGVDLCRGLLLTFGK